MLHRSCVAAGLAGAVLVMGSGCTAPERTAAPTIQTVAAGDESRQDALWDICHEVLRDQRFEIDRLDRRAGVMTTRPQTAQHFFEFWRHDVDTPYDFAEASLRTVRRSVTVTTTCPPKQDECTLDVVVRRELFSTPERQFNSSVAGFRMFGTGLPAEATGLPVGRTDDYWIDDGRDPAMERYLLERILAEAGA